MFLRALPLVVILFPLASTGLAGEAKGKATTDLQDLQGTWQMDSFEDAKKTRVDPRPRTLFFGATAALFRDGNRVLMGGVVSIATGKTPRRLDIAVKQGERQGGTMLGIYELKGDSLKVCFDPEGDSRPAAFAAKAGTSHFVAVYRRVNKSAGAIDIVGKYTVTADQGTGQQATMTAEIKKLGDGYQITWSVPGGVAYTGIGIRTGDVLSVTWGNRGSVGLSVYRITRGPKLSGQYTMLGGPGMMGREELKSAKDQEVKARKRE
jgi:uncharacterized protein (TIGR03067 family)